MSHPTHVDGKSLVEQPRLVDYMGVRDSLNWLCKIVKLKVVYETKRWKGSFAERRPEVREFESSPCVKPRALSRDDTRSSTSKKEHFFQF